MKDGDIQAVYIKEDDEFSSILFPYRGKLQEDFTYLS